MLRPDFIKDRERKRKECKECGCALPYWREVALYRMDGRLKAVEELLIKYGAEGICNDEKWDEKR